MSWFNLLKRKKEYKPSRPIATGGGSKGKGYGREELRHTRADTLSRGKLGIRGLGHDAGGYARPKTKTAGREEDKDLILRPELEALEEEEE